MASPKQIRLAGSAQNATLQETTRLTLSTTLAVGAAAASVISAYGFVAEPSWAVGNTAMITLLPILFCAASVFVWMQRPVGYEPAHLAGTNAYAGQSSPGTVRAEPQPERADLAHNRQQDFNADMLWHHRAQTKLNRVLWPSYLICAVSFGAALLL